MLFFLFQVYATENGHCVYSLSDQDTFKSHLPVTCLRWKPVLETDSYGNVLLATCKFNKGFFFYFSLSLSPLFSFNKLLGFLLKLARVFAF